MYLKSLSIKNYRNIKNLSLDFRPGVNVIIGENNSGKTSIIDTLRICLGYGDYDRDLYIRHSDYYVDKNDPDIERPVIEFDLVFEIQEPIEAGWFRDLLVQKPDGGQELQMHHRYFIEIVNDVEKHRRRVWGGENEGQQIEPDILDLLKQVYLGALRDAVQALKPTKGNKLGELYSKLKSDIDGNEYTEEKREKLAKKVQEVLQNNDDWQKLVITGLRKVNNHLDKTSIKGKEQEVKIDFLPFEFRRLVEYLRIQIPVYKLEALDGDLLKQKYFEIYQNGLGYNNLIYTATVLGDLKVIKEIEPETYIALLIEEPEAHLQPQLQNIFFNYLSKLNDQGFQLFITSHSPTLTAKSDLDSLIVLKSNPDNIYSFSIRGSSLSDTNKKYLSKFLDVTKSQLFFSNGILIVEGISEALLMQIFSTKIGENQEYDLEKKGVEIVNIGGVAFEHFAKLFNNNNVQKRLQSKCSIITDDDKSDDGEISDRAKKAEELEGGNLKVFLANKTFEYELFIASEDNREILTSIFQDLHPIAAGRIEQGGGIHDFALSFLEKVESNNAKSRLAHALSVKLSSDPDSLSRFSIPGYIENAIKWLFE